MCRKLLIVELITVYIRLFIHKSLKYTAKSNKTIHSPIRLKVFIFLQMEKVNSNGKIDEALHYGALNYNTPQLN